MLSPSRQLKARRKIWKTRSPQIDAPQRQGFQFVRKHHLGSWSVCPVFAWSSQEIKYIINIVDKFSFLTPLADDFDVHGATNSTLIASGSRSR